MQFISGEPVVAGDGTSYHFTRADVEYLDTPDHADFNLGSADFSFTVWANFDSDDAASAKTFFSHRTDANNQMIFNYNDGTLEFFSNVGGVNQAQYTASWNPTLGVFHYIELSRDDATADDLFIFIDGTALVLNEVTAIAGNSLGNYTGTFQIGASNAGETMDGFFDAIRLVIGVADNVTNYTKPSTEPVDDANTALLINCGETLTSGTTGVDGVFNDSEASPKVITEQGTTGTATRSTSTFKF